MKLVALDGYTLNPGDNSWRSIEELGELIVHDRTPAEKIVERACDADILLCNKISIGQAELEQLPKLKMIAVTATGFNTIDVEAARRRGLPVCNAPEYSTRSVAQHVFAMLLAYLHQPTQHDLAVRDGQWMASGDFSFWLTSTEDLVGQTMGIIGYGKIGQAVGRLAEAFGMKVVAYSPRPKRDEFPTVDWVELKQLLEVADVVALHCPQTAENVGMVDAGFLEEMKSTAILINAARSGLVVESALVNALRKHEIRAALLDVTSTEPIQSDNELLGEPNCLITPHMAWASLDARKRLVEITAANIRAFLDGQPINVVN